MRYQSIAIDLEIADFCNRPGQVEELVGLFPHPRRTLELAPCNLYLNDALTIVFGLDIGMVFRTTQTRIETIDMNLPEAKRPQ